MVLTVEEARTRGDATVGQRAELHSLLSSKAVDRKWRAAFFKAVRRAEGLSSEAADDALIYLRSLAEDGQQPTHSTPAPAHALRELLRSRIIPGSIATAILTKHDRNELPYVQADRAIREWLAMARSNVIAASALTPGPGATAPDGYFAITIADGTTRCYRIHTLTARSRRVVEQIVNEAGRTRKLLPHEAYPVLREVAANPAAAAALYGKTRDRCSRCNQKLSRTDQPGYPFGYGRDCWDEIQRETAEAAR